MTEPTPGKLISIMSLMFALQLPTPPSVGQPSNNMHWVVVICRGCWLPNWCRINLAPLWSGGLMGMGTDSQFCSYRHWGRPYRDSCRSKLRRSCCTSRRWARSKSTLLSESLPLALWSLLKLAEDAVKGPQFERVRMFILAIKDLQMTPLLQMSMFKRLVIVWRFSRAMYERSIILGVESNTLQCAQSLAAAITQTSWVFFLCCLILWTSNKVICVCIWKYYFRYELSWWTSSFTSSQTKRCSKGAVH